MFTGWPSGWRSAQSGSTAGWSGEIFIQGGPAAGGRHSLGQLLAGQVRSSQIVLIFNFDFASGGRFSLPRNFTVYCILYSVHTVCSNSAS